MTNEEVIERESMEVDVVIVGAGPSGLAAGIRLMQLAGENDQELSICIVEKGSEVGAHILSGAVLEPRALDELLPNWKELGAPVNTPVTDEKMMFLSEKGATGVPGLFLPPPMHNKGNYIISLGNLCRWLGEQAEAMGVEIYPGFAAAEILFDDNGAIKGIATGDMGIGEDGQPGPNYQPGMELHAKYTFFSEGCRGHLGKQLKEKFDLEKDVQTQTYGIGIKAMSMAARFCIIWKITKWPSDSLSGWITKTPISAPMTNFNVSRPTRPFAPLSKAVGGSPMALGRSMKVVRNASPNCISQGAF